MIFFRSYLIKNICSVIMVLPPVVFKFLRKGYRKEMKHFSEDFSELVAVIPQYGDLGNACTLWFPEDERIVGLRAMTVMEHLFYDSLVNLQASVEYYGNLLNLRRNVPLVLDEDRIFLPVKVRKPLFKNDGAYGFVRLDMVASVKDYQVELFDGRSFSSLMKAPMLRQILSRGMMLETVVSRSLPL